MKPWEQTPGPYAGIGSRETPDDVMFLMRGVARALGIYGWTLRSGAAPGADTAFELGSDEAQSSKEIYLPWEKFQGRDMAVMDRPSPEAMRIAKRYHPAWQSLSPPARLLHARNVHQILGADCDSPSRFVLCWTKDGATHITGPETGGTGQAIRIAVAWDVPVYNLKNPEIFADWDHLITVGRV